VTGPDRVLRPVSAFFFEVRKKLFHLVHNEGPERGGGEELQFESQEGQELSAGAGARQLILNMNSEDLSCHV
jgi:hypothetical protein